MKMMTVKIGTFTLIVQIEHPFRCLPFECSSGDAGHSVSNQSVLTLLG